MDELGLGELKGSSGLFDDFLGLLFSLLNSFLLLSNLDLLLLLDLGLFDSSPLSHFLGDFFSLLTLGFGNLSLVLSGGSIELFLLLFKLVFESLLLGSLNCLLDGVLGLLDGDSLFLEKLLFPQDSLSNVLIFVLSSQSSAFKEFKALSGCLGDL